MIGGRSGTKSAVAIPVPIQPDAHFRFQAALRRDDFLERLPAFSGPAPDRQANPALVRRVCSRVVGLHGFLPGHPVCWLRLCGLGFPAPRLTPSGCRSCRAACGEPHAPADPGGAAVEADRQRGPDALDPGSSAHDYRPTLLPAIDYGPADPNLDRARLGRDQCLSLLLTVESGLPAGIGELPVCPGAAGGSRDPALRLVRRLCPVHRPVHRLGRLLSAARTVGGPGSACPCTPCRARP